MNLVSLWLLSCALQAAMVLFHRIVDRALFNHVLQSVLRCLRLINEPTSALLWVCPIKGVYGSDQSPCRLNVVFIAHQSLTVKM